ncbi:MAG TPA: hypothetical protein V6D06_09780 [Trichocoleus sp.]
MLTGIQAFEARWLDLRGQHPTTRNDNTVIAHAMGQLIDQYETPAQIEEALPDHLRGLFRELAIAYFQGYRPAADKAIDPPSESCPEPPSSPVSSHQAKTPDAADPHQREISAAVEKVRNLAQSTRCVNNATRGCRPDDPSEAETLIIEFPEGWPRPT